MIVGLDGNLQVVEAAVTGDRDRPGADEIQVIYSVAVIHRKVNRYAGVADVGALHVFEELLAQDIVKFMFAFGQTLQGELIFAEFSHW